MIERTPLLEDLTHEERKALDIMAKRRGFDDEFWVEHRRRLKSAEFSQAFEEWAAGTGWDGSDERRQDLWWVYLKSPEYKTRELARLQTEEREVNKDGTISCGVFIPLPYDLAKEFPDKSNYDDSVPHFTILYVGDCSPDAYKTLCKIVGDVARKLKPFRIDLSNYSEFTSTKGLKIAHMEPGMLGQMRLALIHGIIRRALEQFGKEVEIKHVYGVKGKKGAPYEAQFLAHATLAYLAPQVPYTGPKPTGSWLVNEIECWGHEKVRFPLGKLRVDQPSGLTRSPLTVDYPMAVPNADEKNVASARYVTVDELRARARDLMKRTGLSGKELLRKTRQEDVLPGGLADKSKPEDFDPKQLAMGIKVELEHTNDPKLAREIAMDHLKEDPRYYTKLKKIEPRHEDASDMTRLRGYETHPGVGGSSGDIGLAGSIPYLDGLKKIDAKLQRKKLKGLA